MDLYLVPVWRTGMRLEGGLVTQNLISCGWYGPWMIFPVILLVVEEVDADVDVDAWVLYLFFVFVVVMGGMERDGLP